MSNQPEMHTHSWELNCFWTEEAFVGWTGIWLALLHAPLDIKILRALQAESDMVLNMTQWTVSKARNVLRAFGNSWNCSVQTWLEDPLTSSCNIRKSEFCSNLESADNLSRINLGLGLPENRTGHPVKFELQASSEPLVISMFQILHGIYLYLEHLLSEIQIWISYIFICWICSGWTASLFWNLYANSYKVL